MDIKNEENADVKPDAIVVVKQEEQHPVDITVKEEKECIEKCNGETSDDVKPDENGRMECEIDMKESDDYDELNELISDEVKNGQDSANADKKLETLQIAIKQLYNDPSFAVVCSFFNKFACFLGIKPQNFNKLERLLTSFHETGRVDRELIDLHLTLLRKLNYKSARVNGWERYLLKYCSLNQSLESEYLNIERYGYLHSSINTKLAVLKTLCENQFDYNIKFKDSVTNSLQANELRLIAIGADINGLSYWYQQDYDLNIRIYSEEEDDHSGGTWNLIAKSKNELESLIEKLKSICPVNIKPEVLSKINENSEQENASLRCKRGILIDTFQSEASIKPIRKEMKCAKGKKKKMEEVKKGDDVEENKSDGSVQIPEELESFIDRRILPKRSARNAAITHLKQLTTPSGKKRTNNSANTNKTSTMKNNTKVSKSKQQVTSNVVTNSKRSEAVETEVASAENNNNNEDDRDDNSESNESDSDNSSNENSEQDDFLMDDQSEQSSSDDDFMPLCEIKKRFSKKNDGKKSRRRKKKKLDPMDMNEMDCDDDELDDSDHEHVKKERKMATEETLCKHCAKSSNPEVLLLCDMCDEAWHTWCLKPLLWYVPDGDWFCPKCQHLMLINKLNLVIVLLEDDLKKKDVEDKRKEAAAERLKREMEYIGVSLNNIIPSSMEVKEDHSESSEESDVDDGERKSKKKANRLLNHHRRVVHPIVPIALGRSRRHVAKVDYKFGDYDNLIQEAMESIDETSTKQKVTKDSCRPQGGLGVGKDMANIINAENQRKSSMDSSTTIGDEKPVQQKSNVGKAPKSHRRLNNLDVDELTESDSEEYHASEESTEASDAISDDTDEYVPSDEARRRSTRRARSVDDFVVSGSEESEYEPVKKKPNKKPSRSSKRSRKRGRRLSTSTEDSTTEEETEMDLGEESDSEVSNKRRRQSVTKRRWAPHESSSDEEEDDYDDVKRTETGRPLRKAVVKAKKAEEEKSNEDDSMSDESKGSDDGGGDAEQHPKSISGGKKRKRISSDEGDFEPDEEEVDEEEEEENATGEEDEQESDDNNKAECSTKPNANDETNKEIDEKKSDDKEEKCDESKQEKTKEEVSEDVNVSDTNKLSAQPEQANSESEIASPVATITAVKVEPVKTEELVNKVTPSVSQPSTSKTVMPTTISHPINYPVPCSSSAPSPAIVNDPSKVIQQMAKLATPIQSVPINATYPPPPHMSFQPVLSAHGSAPIHINNPYIAYSSHHKLPTYIVPPSATNIYGIRPGAIPAQTLPQTTYHLKAPPLIAPHYTQSHPTTLHSDQWSTPTLYSNTNNLFDTSSTTAPMMIPLAQPIIPIPATTSSANANSSLPDNNDSLGNVLASAMDY